jgi:2-dehydropantoate 2-reductase
VSVVARGAHLAAIAAGGIEVRAPDGVFHATVRAAADAAELGPQDAVLVTVKAPALASVAAAIAPLLGPATPVAFVMNGIPWWYFHGHGGALEGRRLARVDPGDALWQAVGPQRAIGGVIYSASAVVEPGVIAVEHVRSRLVLGEPDGTASERCMALAAAVAAGGAFLGETTPRIRDVVWQKLAMNLATGPLAVLTQSAPSAFLAEPAAVAAARAVLGEAVAIASALGCDASVDAERTLRFARGLAHRPSILQDLDLGRPMEIDALYGATLELAALAGVAAPTLEMLTALVRVRARAAGLYDG